MSSKPVTLHRKKPSSSRKSKENGRNVPCNASFAVEPYILTVEPERLYTHKRFHWGLSSVRKPDELLAWGHAPTRELAGIAAANEIEKLESGLSPGGRVTITSTRLV
jgi:hypothetical protein